MNVHEQKKSKCQQLADILRQQALRCTSWSWVHAEQPRRQPWFGGAIDHLRNAGDQDSSYRKARVRRSR